MPIVAKVNEGRPPVAAGSYHAVCFGIVDLGEQTPRNPKYRPSQRVMFMWELPDERVQFDRDGKQYDLPRTISREFPLSLGSPNKPTKLRTFLEAWRGRKFTADEQRGFDVKDVLGANGLLTVVHNVTESGTWANADSMGPLVKGMTPKKAELDLTYFTLTDIPEGAPLKWPETIPEWIRKKICASTEYLTRYESGAGAVNNNGAAAVAQALGDDDIPF